MHLSRQATEVKQGVIITNKNLQFHFKGHNNDLLVLKQWKGAFNRIMPSLSAFCNCFVRRPRAQALSCIYYIASLRNVLLTFFYCFLQNLEDNLGLFALSIHIARLLNLKAFFTCVTFRTSTLTKQAS